MGKNQIMPLASLCAILLQRSNNREKAKFAIWLGLCDVITPQNSEGENAKIA